MGGEWTRDPGGGPSEWWDRRVEVPGGAFVLEATDCPRYHGDDPAGWRWRVGIDSPPGHYIVAGLWRRPFLATREEAQAAAEEWVRAFARGLLDAVGHGESGDREGVTAPEGAGGEG